MTQFFRGMTHILWKSSGVNAILANLQRLEEKVSPQPGATDIKCNSPIMVC